MTCTTCSTATSSSTACCDSCATTTTCAITGPIDPVTISTVSASTGADNKFSVQSTIKKLASGSGTQSNTYTGQTTEDVPAVYTDYNGVLVYNAHTKLMEVMTDLIQSIYNSSYVPPTDPVVYDSVGAPAVTDNLATEAAFITYVKNATVNNATPDLSVGDNVSNISVTYIIKAMYGLFKRVQIHIESASTGSTTDLLATVCPEDSSSGSRLLYSKIENCLFCLDFRYN